MEYNKWQYLDNLQRMKVYGGWIVMHKSSMENEECTSIAQSESMCFVPDPEHKWQ